MEDILLRLRSPSGTAIIVAFPILFFLTGIVIRRREAAGRSATPPRIMRYLVLPSAFAYLFSQQILRLPPEHLSVKITETILTVFAMSFLFSAMNYLLFSEHNILTGRETIPKLGRDVLNFILSLVAGAFVLSSVWGLDLGNLLAALGVSSLVVGLALQQVLGNLFNGISLLMARPFKKGDWVQIGDDRGRVVDFTWRSVKIVTRFDELVIIPNNVMSIGTIRNFSRPGRKHAEIVTVGFSYQHNPKDVKAALLEMALSTEGILHQPEPEPLTLSYDDFSINYGVKFFIADYEDEVTLRDRLMTRIYDTAENHGLQIPFPIRHVHLMNESRER